MAARVFLIHTFYVPVTLNEEQAIGRLVIYRYVFVSQFPFGHAQCTVHA